MFKILIESLDSLVQEQRQAGLISAFKVVFRPFKNRINTCMDFKGFP